MRGRGRRFGMDMYTLYLKWIASKDLPYSSWSSAQCYAADWLGGELGGEWIHVCIYIYGRVPLLPT